MKSAIKPMRGGDQSRRRFLAQAAGAGFALGLPSIVPAMARSDRPVRGDGLIYSTPFGAVAHPGFFQALKESGVDYIWLDIALGRNGDDVYRNGTAMIDNAIAWRQVMNTTGSAALALSAQDILDAKARGVPAIVFQVQGLGAAGDTMADFVAVLDHGIKVAQLTHNDGNPLASSFFDLEDKGLSHLGHEAVAELNARRVLIDLAHASPQTMLDTAAASAQPCVISHTGLRALNASVRNADATAARAVVDKGGVIGIFNMLVWLTAAPGDGPSGFVDHVVYALDRYGEDHVGVGTDAPIEGEPDVAGERERHQSIFDEGDFRPGYYATRPDHVRIARYQSPQRYDRMAEDLSAAGVPGRVIDKVLGENLFRVFAEVVG